MKVTFVIKDKADAFYTAVAEQKSNLKRFHYLNAQHYNVTKKEGSGSFRDRVELNQLIRAEIEPAYKLEPRRGYMLATFEFTK